jgi:hypothetical protein
MSEQAGDRGSSSTRLRPLRQNLALLAAVAYNSNSLWGQQLKLTDDQIAHARACGIDFLSASPSQVQRLSMQRRIFQIDGQPFLATRIDGYYETVGTLMRMIDDNLRDRSPEPSRESPEAGAAHVNNLPVPIPASAKVEANSLIVPTHQAVEVSPPDLAEMTDSAPIAVGSNEVDNPTPIKRGRGRPRKHPRALLDGSQEAARKPGHG